MKKIVLCVLSSFITFSALSATSQVSTGENSPNIVSSGSVTYNGNTVSSTGDESVIITDGVTVITNGDQITIKVRDYKHLQVEMDCPAVLNITNTGMSFDCK